MLKKIFDSTLFGIAGIVVTAVGAVTFFQTAIVPRFSGK